MQLTRKPSQGESIAGDSILTLHEIKRPCYVVCMPEKKPVKECWPMKLPEKRA